MDRSKCDAIMVPTVAEWLEPLTHAKEIEPCNTQPCSSGILASKSRAAIEELRSSMPETLAISTTEAASLPPW